MSQATLTFTAGRLVCGHIRDMLNQAKFLWPDVSYYESSGWLERNFIIKGDAEHVAIIKRNLDGLFARLREE